MPNKSIFSSKTFWGAAISLVAVLGPSLFTYIGLSADASSQATVVDKIVGGISFLLTVYGRFKATGAVSLTGK